MKGTWRCGILLLLAVLVLAPFLPAAGAAGPAEGFGRQAPILTGKVTAMALDRQDRIYGIPAGENRVAAWDREGRSLPGLDGLTQPVSLAVGPDDRIFAGSVTNGSVQVFGADRKRLHALGQGDGELGRPLAIAVAANGTVYVADDRDGVIKVYDGNGRRLFSFAGAGSGAGQLNHPTALAVDDVRHELLVADLPLVTSAMGPHEGARVQVFDLAGRYRRAFGTFGIGDGLLIKPLGLAVDDAGRVLVSDAYQNVVQVFAGDGEHLSTIFDLESPLRTPLSVAVASTGQVLVASLNAGTVEVFGPAPTPVVEAWARAGGRIAPAGRIPVPAGQDLRLAVSAEAGYHVAAVLVDGDDAGPLAELTMPRVLMSHAVEARFALNEYTIEATSSPGGAISPPGLSPVLHGQDQGYEITPDPGLAILDVLVDGVSQGPVASYTFRAVDRSHIIHALFGAEPVNWPLTVQVQGLGSVAAAGIACPDDCSAQYPEGTPVTLVATAGAEQVFAGWSGACTGAQPSCQLTMDEAKTAAARFLPAASLVTFDESGLGTLPWISGGVAPWQLQNGVSRSGSGAMAAGAVGDAGLSFLEVALEATAPGEVGFWARISTLPEGQLLRFLVDGEERGRWSGERDWDEERFAVEPGRHVLRWEYLAQGAEQTAAGMAWLDDVSLPPIVAPSPYPVPDLKANDLDTVDLAAAGRGRLSVAVAPGAALGVNCEWYLLIRAGQQWLAYDSTRQIWQRRLVPFWRGALDESSYAHRPVVELPPLPPGSYTFYYLVDFVANGRLTPAALLADGAVLRVTP
ncbi:MAG: hypothetical protein AB1634_01870 [Thermodesulfobacteriota bacterium]